MTNDIPYMDHVNWELGVFMVWVWLRIFFFRPTQKLTFAGLVTQSNLAEPSIFKLGCDVSYMFPGLQIIIRKRLHQIMVEIKHKIEKKNSIFW